MNKLRTELQGGFPLMLDDIRFLDNELRNGLSQIIKTVSDKCILWGCNLSIDNGIASISEGYVYFNDEIFYCPTHQKNFDSGIATDIVLQIKQYDSPEQQANRIFADNSTHNVWAIREVEMELIGGATHPYIIIKGDNKVGYYLDIIRQYSDVANIANSLKINDWIIPTLKNGWAIEDYFKIRKTNDGYWEIIGKINGENSSNANAFALPSPIGHQISSPIISNSAYIGQVTITTSGEVFVRNLINDGHNLIYTFNLRVPV